VSQRDTTDATSNSGTEDDVEATEPESEKDEPENKLDGQALLAQMGGFTGLIYSSLPVLAFVPVNTYFGLVPAISAALGVATVILAWRLIRRESLQPAISGYFGVGVSALVAWWLGEAKGFFLVGIWQSLVYAAVFGLSVLVRRPLVGYLWGWLSGHGSEWRGARRAVYAFDVATIVWALVFGARFAVQHNLYDADKTGWLGVARIAMGWPLTAVAALATYLAIRAAQRALHDQTQVDVAEAGSQPDAT
jgi:hypothetical protein